MKSLQKVRSFCRNFSGPNGPNGRTNFIRKNKKTNEMLKYYLNPNLEEIKSLYQSFARFSTSTEWSYFISNIYYKQHFLLKNDLFCGYRWFGEHKQKIIFNLDSTLDNRGHDAILNSFLATRQYEECLKYGAQIADPSSEIISKMLMALIKMKNFREYDKLRSQMNQNDIIFSVKSFNLLISELSKIRKDKLVVQEWKYFKIGGLDDGLVFFPIVKAHAHLYEFDEIINLIKLIKKKNIKDVSIFSIIMKAYLEKEMYKDIELLLKEMKDMDMNPDIKFYTELVNVYFKQRKFEKIDEIIIQAEKLHPDIIFFNNLLSKYSQIHNSKKYNQVLNMIERSGLAPDAYTISTILNAIGFGLGNSNDIAIIEEKHQVLFKQPKLCQSALMRAYSYKGQFEKAKEIWKKYNLQTPMALSIAVDTAGRAKDHEWLQKIVQRIDSKSLNQNNLISLIEAYCRLKMFGEALKYSHCLVNNFVRFENRKKAFLTIGQGFVDCKDINMIQQVIDILTGPLKNKYLN